ncbi:MAG: right-handed parallel beta-helix repeat-containing protein [bacterium]
MYDFDNPQGEISGICNYASSGGSSPIIHNCTIDGNEGFYSRGITCYSASPIIFDCMIGFNIGKSNLYQSGNGIGINCIRGADPLIERCEIYKNGGLGGGAGIECRVWCSPIITNCLIWGNHATQRPGGGIRCTELSSPHIMNCTIVDNITYSLLGGGGISIDDDDSSPTITNCIIWRNTPHSIYYPIGLVHPVVTFSNIQGGFTGTGNINNDPSFVSPGYWRYDYHLQAGSPCIDLETSMDAPGNDKDNVVRPLDGDGDGMAEVDMGAYEYYGDEDGDGAPERGPFPYYGLFYPYDGNNDGIPDFMQPDVASFPSDDAESVFTVKAPPGSILKDVRSPDSGSLPKAPSHIIHPFGYFSFTVTVDSGQNDNKPL